ncbi:MAG: hypothetical protein LLF75_13210 [Eubacteriales bacterium]|nr:hypothetical protein [Eubacteriales bacterium]
MKRKKRPETIAERFPPSAPCSCGVCRSFCRRPGWWTVQEAARALAAGYGGKMMLELSPDHAFGVLSPAFSGCEGTFAFQEFAQNGCCFLKNGLCGLHDTGFEPLECRFCHHERMGQGNKCHAALERDWKTPAGQALVKQWLARRLRLAELEPAPPSGRNDPMSACHKNVSGRA